MPSRAAQRTFRADCGIPAAAVRVEAADVPLGGQRADVGRGGVVSHRAAAPLRPIGGRGGRRDQEQGKQQGGFHGGGRFRSILTRNRDQRGRNCSRQAAGMDGAARKAGKLCRLARLCLPLAE